MDKRRLRVFALALAVSIAAAAALIVPSLGDARAAATCTGACVNFTPGQVKLLHTGGSQPNSQYADLGRLTVPVGSYVITAHTVLRAQATTGIECFLVAPGASAHGLKEISSAKGSSIQDMLLTTATTAPNGGNIDLFCKVSSPAADRRVFAQDTSIVAISVSGVTVANNPAPPLGSY